MKQRYHLTGTNFYLLIAKKAKEFLLETDLLQGAVFRRFIC